MKFKLHWVHSKSHSVKWLYLTTLVLFEYEPRDKRKKWAYGALQQKKRLITGVKKCIGSGDDQGKAKQSHRNQKIYPGDKSHERMEQEKRSERERDEVFRYHLGNRSCLEPGENEEGSHFTDKN